MSSIPDRYQGLTLGEAIELFLTAKSGRKEATLRHYRDDLGRFAGYIGLDTTLVSIAPEDLDRYLAHRRGEGIQEITVHHDYRALKVFYNLAHRRRWITENAILAIDPPRVPKKRKPRLSDEQVAELMDACLTVRDLAIVAVLVDTGVRASELCRLRPCDINVDKKQIYILGKGDKERLVPLSATAWEFIQAYLESGERPSELTDSDPLFASRIASIQSQHNNVGLTINGLKQILKRLAKRAGVKGRVYPHLLRHTFGTRWCEKGGNTRILQDVMGHSDIRTTQAYAQPGMQAVIDNHADLRILGDIAAQAKPLRRFKVLYDKPGGPTAEIHEAADYVEAEGELGDDLFLVGILDADEDHPEANRLQVVEDLDLVIELHPENDTMAIRNENEMIVFSTGIAGALARTIMRGQALFKRQVSLRRDAQVQDR